MNYIYLLLFSSLLTFGVSAQNNSLTANVGLLKSKLRYSDNIGIIEMPLWRSFQIDSQNDLELIKKLI